MRLQLTRIAALVAGAALVVGLAGCGGTDESLPLRTISFVGPTSGPLKSRVADIRRAAELELEAIDGDTDGHRLKLVDGPDQKSVATIDALAQLRTISEPKLTISLSPPPERETGAPVAPVHWLYLLPPQSLTEQARSIYAASGATGSASAVADTPLRAGTPRGQYVTPALSAENYPPAGREFFEKFEDKYDRAPDRYAIYGYEAVGVIVDGIARLEEAGDPVTQWRLSLAAHEIRDRYGPVGHYDVLPSGQTTLYVFQARGNGAPLGDAALIEALR